MLRLDRLSNVARCSQTALEKVLDRRRSAHATMASENRPPSGMAKPIKSLAALRAATQACRACPLGARATQAVNGEGCCRA